MADLEQWLPAVPEGEQLLAAAPLVGEWWGPADGWRAALPAAIAAGTVRLAIPGAAGRVAELAAPVLRRRQPDGRQAAASR